MRLVRVRFTIQRLMVMIGLVAVILGTVEVRRQRKLVHEYRARATFHEIMAATTSDIVLNGSGSAQGLTAVMKVPGSGQKAYHEEMKRKYEQAADRPWLWVQPDPSPPSL